METETHAQIIKLLDEVGDMTVATIRPDGFPLATVVAFVHDDLVLYFSTSAGSQKAQNIAACDKVSCTITRRYERWDEIEGLSLGGHAHAVTDPDELRRVRALMDERFPQLAEVLPETASDTTIFRVDPVAMSLLDYSRGFGHADLIEVQPLLAPSA